MSYASASDVAVFCPNLLTGASNFSASSVPTLTAVEGWLERSSGLMDNLLGSRGFTPPSASSSEAWQIMQEYNTYYAVAMAEMARTNTRLSPGERTRGQQFLQMWKDGLEDLRSGDISQNFGDGGATYKHRGYVGGVSVSDKDNVAENGDRVPMRISRGMFDNPKAPTKVEGTSRVITDNNSGGGIR